MSWSSSSRAFTLATYSKPIRSFRIPYCSCKTHRFIQMQRQLYDPLVRGDQELLQGAVQQSNTHSLTREHPRHSIQLFDSVVPQGGIQTAYIPYLNNSLRSRFCSNILGDTQTHDNVEI